MPSIFRILGRALFRGDATGSGNAVEIADSSGTNRLVVANQGRVTVSQDASVTTQTVSVIQSGTTNAGLVLNPNGTGPLLLSIPDGGIGGGNARGNYSIDFQYIRSAATQVASGLESVVIGGRNGTASGSYSTRIGGFGGTASGYNSVSMAGGTASNNDAVSIGTSCTASGDKSTVIGGNNNIASNTNSFVGGGLNNTASGSFSSTLGGTRANAYLYGQRAVSSGRFTADSDAQTSSLTARREITGTGITELTLDGGTPAAGNRIILNITAGPTNARAWRAQIDVVAITATVGNGTGTLNDCFMGSYSVAIKNAAGTVSLVGEISSDESSDTSMDTSLVSITADNTNDALKIEFTPPSATAGSTSVYRVVATAYLTEVGR